jgi:pimeloyl-ACP methyl ester carboxylesterase
VGAAVIAHLGIEQSDVLGYSLGGGAALCCAIQHPERVRRLVVVSFPFRHSAWYPEVREAFAHMGRAQFEQLRQAPLYDAWCRVAPDPDAFPELMDRMGALQRRDFDWSDEVRMLPAPTMVMFADADSVAPSHAAEYFGLLGGGQGDAGWDGVVRRPSSRLAILPGHSHYDVWSAPELPGQVESFLQAAFDEDATG